MIYRVSIQSFVRSFPSVVLLILMGIFQLLACKPGSGLMVIGGERLERDQKLPNDDGAAVIAIKDTSFIGSDHSCQVKALERFKIKSAKEIVGLSGSAPLKPVSSPAASSAPNSPSRAASDFLEIELMVGIPGCATGLKVKALKLDVVIENIEIEGGQEQSPEEKKESQFKVLSTYQFPMNRLPDLDYTKDGRGFGARRERNRLHAANDLIGPKGSSVIATADGTIKDYYEFYCGTFAIVIDHGSYTALYGEVGSLASGLKIGSKVRKGQKIAQLAELCEGSTMLHFEKYLGTEKGPLTVRTNLPYQRRKDLVSPTTFLRSLEITAQK